MLFHARSVLALLLLLGAAPALAVQSFTPLGDLSGDIFFSEAYALSGDGTVAVGMSHSSNGMEAFRWTPSPSTMTGLGDLPPNPTFRSFAHGTSDDGTVVVGVGNTLSGNTAFTWNTTSSTLAALAPLDGSGTSQAFGVSGNGTTAVGQSTSTPGVQATSWAGAGPVALGDLGGGAFRSVASAASDDGLTIVGDSDSSNGVEAFRWVSGVMTGLGDLAGGGFDSQAFDVSSDGSLVVGRGESDNGSEAFLWSGGPMLALGDLPGGSFSSTALGVSDGGDVVGSSSAAGGLAAFLYSGGTMYSVLNVLEANGLAAAVFGWDLREAVAISDDGLTIAGWGVNPSGDTEAWVASFEVVPEPGTGALLAMGLALLARRRSRAL